MNFLKKGPDLSMSSLKRGEMKMPPFLVDLYYDLRDRRLLPLLALVLVAIVAVPFLLGGGSDEEESPAAPKAGAAVAVAEASGADASKLAVVESKPGLRDYRKRLEGEPKNPFRQHYTGPVLKGSELNTTTESSSSSPTYTTSTETSSTTVESSSGGAPPISSPQGGEPQLVLFSWAVDVRIAKSEAKSSEAKTSLEGQEPAATQEVPAPAPQPKPATKRNRPTREAKQSAEPSVRHRVLPLTKLPGDKAPVVTFMGPSKHGNPLFLVSGKVKSVFGEARCVSGDDVCQLLELAPEYPVVFVYGENEVHYTFTVLKMELVVTGHKSLDEASQNFSK